MKDLSSMNHYEIWEILHQRGISSSYRSGNDNLRVWVIENGIHRRATDEETKLHEKANDSYLMEEAACGLI